MDSLVNSAWKIIPHFHSLSIKETVEFYGKKLNFTIASVDSDSEDDANAEPVFCSIFIGKKAAANIYFFKHTMEDFREAGAMIAMGTAELDKFYHELKAKGDVTIKDTIADTEWGFRQFSILDPHGNTLTFFKYIEGGNPGTVWMEMLSKIPLGPIRKFISL